MPRLHGHWPAWKKRRVANLDSSAESSQTGRALDFGCGQGVFYRASAEHAPGMEISGTDLSPEALQAARKRFPAATSSLCRRGFHLRQGYGGQAGGQRDPSNAVLRLRVYTSRAGARARYRSDVDLMASFLKPGASMLHILPCGDAGTLERRICSLSPTASDPARGNRFFYEDEGHLRRLHSAEMEAAARRHGLQPGPRRFANAYWGAIQSDHRGWSGFGADRSGHHAGARRRCESSAAPSASGPVDAFRRAPAGGQPWQCRDRTIEPGDIGQACRAMGRLSDRPRP